MMRSENLRPGTIVTYPYLWRWQRDRGETEGRKERPVCVVVAVRSEKDAVTHLALLAISSQPPHPDRTRLEVPEIECRRGGLSTLKRAWISIDEYNYDIAEHSYYFDMRQEPLGRFSKQFMMSLASAFVPFFKDRQVRVPRAD